MKRTGASTTSWYPSTPPGLLLTSWSITRDAAWTRPTRTPDQHLHNEIMSVLETEIDWNRRLLKWLTYSLSILEVSGSESTDYDLLERSHGLAAGLFRLTKDVIEPLRLVPISGFVREEGLCEALWTLGSQRFIVHLHCDRTYDWLHRDGKRRIGSGESIPIDQLFELRSRIASIPAR